MPLDNGNAIKLTSVRDSVVEIDVVAILTIVSNDINIVVNVLYFLYFFFDL